MKKTSKEWHKELFPTSILLDPDGFDRDNLKYSYEQELVTEDEFMTRFLDCTVIHTSDNLK